MPKKFDFSVKDYNDLCNFLKTIGFRVSKKSDWLFAQATKNLKSPRKQGGEKISYVYEANGYRVIVQTTFDAKTKKIVESASGWVLVVDIAEEKRVWSTYPFYRTEGFLEKLKTFAKIAQFQVDHRPICSCETPMDLVPSAGFKEYIWSCGSPKNHNIEVPGVGFFENMKYEKYLIKFFLDFLNSKKPYHDKLKKQGLAPGRAKEKRISWEEN